MAANEHSYRRASAPTGLARRRDRRVHGTSHPDTICDGVAEAASVALCRAYLDGLGDVGDDLLLEGGAFEPWPFPI
jgi:hypothetical protein